MRNRINLCEARQVLSDHVEDLVMSRDDEAAVFALFHHAEARRAAFLPSQFVYGAGELPSWGLGHSAVLLNTQLQEEWAAVDERDWPRLREIPRYGSRVDLAVDLMRSVFSDAEFSADFRMGEFLSEYRVTLRVPREHLSLTWTHCDLGSAIVGATIAAVIERAPADAKDAPVGSGRYPGGKT